MMPRTRWAGCVVGVLIGLTLGPGLVLVVAPPSALAAPSPDLPAPRDIRASSVAVIGIADRVVRLRMPLGSMDASSGSPGMRAQVSVAGVNVPVRLSLAPSARADDDLRSTGSVMVVLDTSGSMAGDRIAAARQAIRAFLEQLPSATRAGLVTFADEVTVQVPAGTDRRPVLAALQRVRTGGDTTLFDAIDAAIDALPPSSPAPVAPGRLVVLSDGADTASALGLDDAVAKIQASGATVDVIALQPTASQGRILDRLASSTDGRVITAVDIDELLPAFEAAGEAFAETAILEVTLPPTLDAQGAPVQARVVAGSSEVTAATVLPDDPALAAAIVQQGPPPPALTAQPSPLVISLAILIFCLVLGAGLAWILARRTADRRDRINQLGVYGAALGLRRQVEPESSGPLASLDRIMARSGRARAVRAALGAADIRLTPASWLMARLVISLLMAAIGVLLLASPLLGSLLGLAAGWLLTSAWLRIRSARRQRAFGDELPDFLLLLASGLRGGMSFTHALEAAAMDGRGEVPRQMRRVLREVQVGTLLDAALLECADRMDNEDLRWTVTALSIQREVGGNLSTILDTAAGTIKSREELRREVRTLSAEGRLSGYILIALPLGVLLVLMLVRRSYVELLWTTTLGLLSLAAMAVLMVLGWLWMRTIVTIKV